MRRWDDRASWCVCGHASAAEIDAVRVPMPEPSTTAFRAAATAPTFGPSTTAIGAAATSPTFGPSTMAIGAAATTQVPQ